MLPSSIKKLPLRVDIHDFIYANWKTDLFRKAHFTEGSFVAKIVDKYAKMPRFTFEMSEPNIEWAHFSTWWGGIPMRTYDNPYIHDLYWIHEMSHAGNMVYVPEMNLENFTRKMTDNELHASVVSEVQIYFEMPELRNLSFKHEIYADRFLKDAGFLRRYKADPELAFEEMKVRRRDTMMDANPKNVADFWIHRFYSQNAAWAACWANSYDYIEQMMYAVYFNTIRESDVPENLRRQNSLNRLLKLLAERSKDGIPFCREAEAFAGIYWANRGHYDDAMKVKEKS